MKIIYKYSTINIRWDCSKEKAVREDLAECVPHMYYVCDKDVVELECEEGNDDVLLATIPNTLKVGHYSMYTNWENTDGKVVLQMQIEDAFVVTGRQIETANPQGQSVTIKLRCGETINIAVAPIPLPVEGEGDNWMHIDTDGDTFMAWTESKVITCRVFDKWHKDITDEVVRWYVTRESGDGMSDLAWQNLDRVRNFKGILNIYHGVFVKGESRNENDLIDDLSQDQLSTKFTFTAITNAGVSSSAILYT